MIFHDMLLHNISLQSERGKMGTGVFKNQNNNFSLEKKMTVSKIYGTAVFFLSFILFLIGCIPLLPPFTGLEIENKSAHTIIIYSDYNTAGYVIPPDEKAIIEVNDKVFTLFIPARKMIKQYLRGEEEKLLRGPIYSAPISDGFLSSHYVLYVEAIFDNSLELYISDSLLTPIHTFNW